jgi:hypothetical protein
MFLRMNDEEDFELHLTRDDMMRFMRMTGLVQNQCSISQGSVEFADKLHKTCFGHRKLKPRTWIMRMKKDRVQHEDLGPPIHY